MSMHLSMYMKYANRKQLLPLNDLVQNKTIDVSDWNSKLLDLGKVNDKIVMLSIAVFTLIPLVASEIVS